LVAGCSPVTQGKGCNRFSRIFSRHPLHPLHGVTEMPEEFSRVRENIFEKILDVYKEALLLSPQMIQNRGVLYSVRLSVP